MAVPHCFGFASDLELDSAAEAFAVVNCHSRGVALAMTVRKGEV